MPDFVSIGPFDPLERLYEFDYLNIVPIVTTPPAPVTTETDASGTVVAGDGSTDAASSQKYQLSGVVSIAWAQEPWRVLWTVRSDGLLLGMTYRRDQGVLAWHRHPMTNGAVEDVAVIPNPQTGRSQVWLMVQRVVDGTTRRYIEYMTDRHEPENSTDTGGYNYLDCSLTYEGSAATEISNLDHLEGETVSVWADGKRHDDKTVSGGSITLDRAAEVVHVGIHTASYILTLPADAGAEIGTAQGKTKIISKVKGRMIETLGAKAGKVLDKLDAIFKRQASDKMDTTPALRSGLFEVKFDSAYDQEGQFYIVQDYPAPMTITAIVPETDTADF